LFAACANNLFMDSSDFILQRLSEWGIDKIFGYPGDGIGGLTGALDRQQDKLDFIQVRHEENAAFMAGAYAKFSGRVGVCLATSGPGAIHLLNGLYDARMDHQPVVAIVGQQPRPALGSSFLQEVDLANLFKDVARDYCQFISHSAQIRHSVDCAVRTALAHRTVTCIIVPNDIQLESAIEEPKDKHATMHSGVGYSAPSVIPKSADLDKAAALINKSEKPAILVGAGALGATAEVRALAEKIGAGVAKALLGRTVLDDDLPYVTGSIGLLGTEPSYEMMQRCDAFIMIGSGFPYVEFLPPKGKVPGVQIDIDGKNLGLRYPFELNLVGDSAETIRALLPLLQQKDNEDWRQQIEKNIVKWWKIMEDRAMDSANPVNPQRVFHEANAYMPQDAIITADSGSVANWYARNLKIKSTMKGSLSGNLASMGAGVPYALAAKWADPGRPVVAFMGDGAMQMSGNSELVTAQKYYKEWADPRLIVVVLNNGDLNQVTWEQRVLAGDPKFEGSQKLPDFQYAEYARMLGLDGMRIDDPDNVAEGWRRAFASDRPFVLEVITDPDIPPMPPHITFEQAANLAKSMLKGDPHTGSMIKNIVRKKVDDWLH
jgi:pyruvate dehydrogenase (quinone)